MPSTSPKPAWADARAFDFGGVRLLDTDLGSAVSSIEAAANSGVSYGLHLCNAYTLSLAARESRYRETLNHESSVNLPDGTPVTWFYRLAHRQAPRGPVRGPSLMKATLDRTSLRHFLLGGTEVILADLERAIATSFPAAHVSGSFAPPFREPTTEDLDDFVRRIKESRAEVVWVGLGTPRQDRVIAALVGRVDAVLVGVGAAFDFISGHKPEAPSVLHRTGLEWAYRLAHEPRRLWRRYLVGNTLFIIEAARELSRRTDQAETPGPQLAGLEALDRVAVGEARVHCIDERTALRLIIEAAEERPRRPRLVVTPNIQHIALLDSDTRFRSAYNRADLVLADGWPVVAAVRGIYGKKIQRVTGADLLPALCRSAAERRLRVGIVGGLDGAASEAAHRLGDVIPELVMAITLEPALGFEREPEQVAEVLRRIQAADLDLLFLALGAPKQEKFAAQNLAAMSAGVTLCIGAAVDFVAGRQRRAPRILRRAGLEWAFRAMHEPRRLIPRYAQSAPVFVRAVARSRRLDRSARV
jgi:N-acetylglucosaminyldiphosphoundecaprenol N-acetyl-beta-D-mannosaminyltransferase